MSASVSADRSAGRRTAATICRWGAQAVMLVALAAAPWYFGAVTASVGYWTCVAMTIALLLAIASRLAHPSENVVRVPALTLILLLGVGYGGFQLLPLPSAAVERLSPATAQMRQTLLDDSRQPGASLAASLGITTDHTGGGPLSIYPGATRYDLALLCLGMVTFTVGGLLFQTRRSLQALLWTVTATGAALAALGLIQRARGQGPFIFGTEVPSNPFATFVNQNHAGGYLNLSLACAVGLVVWSFGTRPIGDDAGPPVRSPQRAGGIATHLTGLRLTTIFLTAILVAGILGSFSRGAFLAMCTAFLGLGLIRFTTGRLGLFAYGTVVLLAAIGLTVWVGLSSGIGQRLETLLDREVLTGHALIPHWKVATNVVRDFWLCGSGLGTSGYVYGMYDEGPIGPWFWRTENQYIQAVVDGGIICLFLLLSALILAWIGVIRLVRRSTSSATAALATAALFALASQTVAAAFDFGLYSPGNLTLLAVIVGVAAGHVRRIRKGGDEAVPAVNNLSPNGLAEMHSRRWTPAVHLTAVTMVAAASVVAAVELQTAADAESIVSTATREAVPKMAPEELDSLAGELRRVAEDRPHDVEPHLALAHVTTQSYRLAAYADLLDQAPESVSEETLWSLTSAEALHARIHDMHRRDDADALASLREHPLVEEYLHDTARHLLRARAACPLMPRVHLGLAELCGLFTDPTQDQVHVERACLIAPQDASLLYGAGRIEFSADRMERAALLWRTSLHLDDRHVWDILPLAETILDYEQFAAWLLPESPQLLLAVARRVETNEIAEATDEAADGDAPSSLRDRLLDRAAAAADKSPRTAERDHLLATIHLKRGDIEQAIKHYRAALDLDPTNASWLHELARLLLAEGQYEEAVQFARRAVRAAPNRAAYQTTLEQIEKARLTRGR